MAFRHYRPSNLLGPTVHGLRSLCGAGDNHDREVLERAHRVAAAACIYLHGNPSPHEEFVPTPSTTVPSLPQWIPESRELYLVHTFGDTEPDVVLLASPEDLRPFSDQERVVVAALLRLAAEQPRYAPELADAERSLLAAA